MSKRAFYITLSVSIIAMLAIAYAIYHAETNLPESSEGSLMRYTCDEVASYETIAAEQDLEALRKIIESHINEYPPSIHDQLELTLMIVDSLRDEVAFHNSDVRMYQTHFKNMLNLITKAELELASEKLASGDNRSAISSVEHARHCLHDALLFTPEADQEKYVDFMDDLNTLITSGLTIEGLSAMVDRL
jgi:hypothetical protein